VKLWRWIIGTIVILVSWLVGGTLLGLVLLPYTGVDAAALLTGGDVLGTMPAWGYLFFRADYLCSFVLRNPDCLPFRSWGKAAVPFFPLLTIFAGGGWPWDFWVWLLLVGTPVVVGILGSPDAYRFEPQWGTFLPFLIVALVLFPIQTTAEELFFRGWIIQWAAGGWSNIWWLSTLSGALFAIPHLLNPEATGDLAGAFVGYFTVGFALGWVTVRDRSLEIAIGAHLSNNLFAGLIVGYEGGALPAEALFVTEPIEWGASNLVGALVIPLFILLTRPGRPKKPSLGEDAVATVVAP